MKVKEIKLIFVVFIILISVFSNGNAQQVSWQEATKIAFEVSKSIFDITSGPDTSLGLKIRKFEAIYYEGKIIGSVFYYLPCGYVIVPYCHEMRPFFTASCSEDLETASKTIESFVIPIFVKQYLEYANRTISQERITKNRQMWDQYLAKK